MTSKEDRRAATDRERTRRNREIEEGLLARARELDWTPATALLDESMVQQIMRLGGTPRDSVASDSCQFLAQGVEWPAVEFRSSLARLVDHVPHHPRGSAVMDEEDLVPHFCVDFRFLPTGQAGAFWEGWEEEFSGVDPLTMIPIGADGAYFVLLTANPANPRDPLLLVVDHEEVHETPYQRAGATMSAFLASLERSNPSAVTGDGGAGEDG